MRKRTYTAKEKARIVQEALLGEKEINQIASENELAPAQIRKWRAEAYENLEMIFDAKRDSKLKEKIASQEHEIEQAYKKVGQLTTKVDWLEKKSEELFGPDWEDKYPTRPK